MKTMPTFEDIFVVVRHREIEANPNEIKVLKSFTDENKAITFAEDNARAVQTDYGTPLEVHSTDHHKYPEYNGLDTRALFRATYKRDGAEHLDVYLVQRTTLVRKAPAQGDTLRTDWNENSVGMTGLFYNHETGEHVPGEMIGYAQGDNFAYASIKKNDGRKALIRSK